MDPVIVERPCISRSQSCFDNFLGFCSPFKESSKKGIPNLKVLAQNTINVYRIQGPHQQTSEQFQGPSQWTAEQTGNCASQVVTDCPVSKSCSDCNLNLCSNKINKDESKIGEKLPRTKSRDFYWFMQQDMKFEKNRLETFRNVWPLSYIDPSDLAAAGFFYLQCGDKVKCAFCRGIIVDWAPGDDPFTEHSLHFPLCPFLMRRDVGNVPILRRNDIMDQDKNSYPEKLGPMRPDNPTRAAASSILYPKFPKMESKEKRLYTFHNWHFQAVKPDDLAEAGFFSTGTSDIVACFSCGGTLGHWDVGDDPWLEHKKHFPHCVYLNSVRHSTVKSSSSEYWESISKPVCGSQSSDISELMKSSVCVEASKIFSEKLVREALTRQLNKKGQGFRNLEDLCSMILEIEDETEKKPNGGLESQVQSKSATSEHHICKICYDKEMGVVFLPCGHMMACPECALSIKTCPLCRKAIENSVRAYIS